MMDEAELIQLEEWKQKYYTSLATLEKQQSYDDLLKLSLGRLALIAKGLDPTLDKQLTLLRNVLRDNKEQPEIQLILNQVEEAITHMESSTTDDKQTTGEIIADLLTSLKLGKPFRAEARTLAKQLNSSVNSDLPALMIRVTSFIEQIIKTTDTKDSRGFISKLFSKRKTASKPQMLDSHHDHIDANTMPNHQVLMALLERLSLPNNLSNKATKIRHQIENGIDDEKLPIIINEIASIVSELGSQVVSEKQDYEAFLKSLTTRLKQLDQHITQANKEDISAFEQRKQLGQAVEEQVIGIRDEVESADNLDLLKSTVSERLDFLNQHFEKYRHSDKTRFEQSQLQITELNSRLQELEQETTTLRESVAISRDLALKDSLTGIWNRQALNEDLEKEYVRWQRYQKPLSLVIWNIDLFKQVNDQYGHAAGDKVLKTIARIFIQATRDADFIARFGGEEFVGIFPETRLEDALILANKIREKIAHSKFHYENKPVPITASAGLATFRPNDTTEKVFKRADSALYQAKKRGRNRCIAD